MPAARVKAFKNDVFQYTPMRLVIKFGGTTIATPAGITSAARFLKAQSKSAQVIGVCSAVGDTTDNLSQILSLVGQQQKERARRLAAKTGNMHKKIASAIVSKPRLQKRILGALEKDTAELISLVDGMSLLGEVTERSTDYLLSFGEKMSTRLLAAALNNLGSKSAAFAGDEIGIITDSNFGQARPLMDTTRLHVLRHVDDVFARAVIPVIGGFVGADQYGRITTLGRGGSDYTATIIGACVKADEIWLMSSVEGLMTADPNIVSGAKVLSEVSYAEVVEMAMFGAKQIHPRTFEPLLTKMIPIRIRSAANTTHRGTLVTGTSASSANKTVKCVSTIPHNGLIDMRGDSMVGSPGTASGIFATLANAGINVMMISQNPSESGITIVVNRSDLDRAVGALEVEHLGKMIKKLEVTSDVAIVALIGEGMRGTAGVASHVFGAVAEKQLNVMMITQGSSELNLALVVKDADAKTAVRAIHNAFELARVN